MFLADVMPNSVNGSCYCQADVICLIYLIGRCYCQEVDAIPLLLADVIANDIWQMFLPLQCIATILIG